MALVAINSLIDEIVAQVSLVASTSFQDRVFSIFDMEEVGQRIASQGYPCALVAYEGTNPNGDTQGVKSTGRAGRSGDTYLVNKRFSVIVAVDYNWSSGVDDQKREATGLLDTVRLQLQGFSGVNNRPWRFITEGPLGDSIDGVALYAQVWETTCTESGNTT